MPATRKDTLRRCQFLLQLILNNHAIQLNKTQTISSSDTHVDRVHVYVSDDPVFALHILSVDRERKVLGHDAVLVDDFHARSLERLAELREFGIFIEFGAEEQAARPCEDGRNGVRGGLAALLVFTVVSGDGCL